MTGSYPARVGLHRGVFFPGYQNGINPVIWQAFGGDRWPNLAPSFVKGEQK